MTRVAGAGVLVAGILLAAGRTGPGLLVLFGAVVLTVASARLRASTGPGRTAAGHGHGTQQMVARHEAGHAAAARALGGTVRSVRMWQGGGFTDARLPNHDPQAAITFWRAGRHAAGTGSGCSADDSLIRRELRSVPRADRARVARDADRDARRIVRRDAARIRRDAQRLLQTGGEG